MQVTAFRREVERVPADEIDREELIESVASLREDVCSMSTDIRKVLTENVELRQEVGRLRARRSGDGSTAELRRLQRQLDRLIEAHELSSARGGGGTSRRGRGYRGRPASLGDEPRGGSWMTRMMMLLMLSELA